MTDVKKMIFAAAALCLFILIPAVADAQITQTQAFRLGEGYIRIAQPGQVADTLSVIGDLNSPGRYIVPRGMKIDEVLAHARGPIGTRFSSENIDWNKIRVETTISRYSRETRRAESTTFAFRYNDTYPAEMWEFELKNGDVIAVEVKRKAAFIDWLRVFSTVVSATATTIIVVDRLSN